MHSILIDALQPANYTRKPVDWHKKSRSIVFKNTLPFFRNLAGNCLYNGKNLPPDRFIWPVKPQEEQA
jgi:hypothetical protein